MNLRATVAILACVLYVACARTAPTPPVVDEPSLFAHVALYDLKPGSESAFLDAVKRTRSDIDASGVLVADRLLAPIGGHNYKFATYTKVSDLAKAQAALDARVSALSGFTRRAPEVHAASVDRSYTPGGTVDLPSDDSFGQGRTGQVAHIGLFVPYPNHREKYDKTLHRVKEITQQRNPRGYIGEDVLTETAAAQPPAQVTLSARARVQSAMSINYGEYDTFENAEDSYLRRHDRPKDADIHVLSRVFYGTLQVPSRFYLFRVHENVEG